MTSRRRRRPGAGRTAVRRLVSVLLALAALLAPGWGALPAVASCGSPTLVRSTAQAVKIGVHDRKTLTYTAYLDDSCVSTADDHNVTVEISRGNDGYAFKDAIYRSTTSDGLQVWVATFTFDPLQSPDADVPLYSNDLAGTWHSRVSVIDTQGGYAFPDGTDLYVQRYSRMDDLNATEPTRKGATETVTATLSRANWEDNLYHGYTVQPVDLQFRTLSGSYGKVTTVASDSGGHVKATTPATVDGCYRFSFLGTTTTPAATSPGDCVDVT